MAECFQGEFLARLMPPVKKELKLLAAADGVTSVQLTRLGADEEGLSGGGARSGGGGGGEDEEDGGGEGGPAGAKRQKARLATCCCVASRGRCSHCQGSCPGVPLPRRTLACLRTIKKGCLSPEPCWLQARGLHLQHLGLAFRRVSSTVRCPVNLCTFYLQSRGGSRCWACAVCTKENDWAVLLLGAQLDRQCYVAPGMFRWPCLSHILICSFPIYSHILLRTCHNAGTLHLRMLCERRRARDETSPGDAAHPRTACPQP